mgnify:CR=1 FL=1
MLASILALINSYGYKAIFILITLENIFPPIPCEIILTFGGFLTTITSLQPVGVVIVATLGSYLGSVIIYFHFKPNSLENSIRWFKQYGKLSIFAGRLIPIIRSIISLPAGITKMNFFCFSFYTLLGTIIWNSILVYLGILLGNNWIKIHKYVKQYALIISILFLIILIIKKTKRKKT